MSKQAWDTLTGQQKAEEALAALKLVTKLTDLFGESQSKAKSRYKAIAKAIHPDILDGDDIAANEAFQMLTRLWEMAEEQMRNGVYGTSIAAGVSKDHVILDGRKYFFGTRLGEGDIADTFLGKDEAGNAVVIKAARNASDNDLMDNELTILDSLKIADGFDQMSHYYPQLVAAGKDTDRCRINVLAYEPQAIETPLELATLNEVVRSFHGLNERHVGWIWRKLITGLAFAHRNGIVHAGLTPDNILITIDNEKHGVVLGGWIYGSENQSKLVGMSKDWADSIYPPDMATRDAVLPTPGLDVYMAAKSMLWACADMSPELFRYFMWCADDYQLARPSDFKSLNYEFERVIFNRLGWNREFIRLNYVGNQPTGQSNIDWNWF